MGVFRRDTDFELKSHHTRHPGAIHVRWYMVVLVALIAIASVAGILGAMAAGHTQVAIVIGVISLAFFSRIAC
jgi:hypothetical protein